MPHDATGPLQSPIDITSPAHSTTLLPLDFQYRGGDVVRSATLIMGNGDWVDGCLQVIPLLAVRLKPDAGVFRLGSESYRLIELHWHTPADHALNGRRPGMELHLVHAHERTGDLLVVGVHYREVPYPDSNDPLLPVFGQLDSFTSAPTIDVPRLDLPALLPPSSRRYRSCRYQGSRTTADDAGIFQPGVQWIILRDQAPVSISLINAHRVLVDTDLRRLQFHDRAGFDFSRPTIQGNARALQPRAGRPILTDA